MPGVEGINSSALNEGFTNFNVGNIENFNIKSISNLTDDLNLPDTSLPDVSSMQELGKDQLSNIDGFENLGGNSEQVGGYSEDIKKIGSGDLADVEQIPQAIEKEVMQMDELGQLSEGTG